MVGSSFLSFLSASPRLMILDKMFGRFIYFLRLLSKTKSSESCLIRP